MRSGGRPSVGFRVKIGFTISASSFLFERYYYRFPSRNNNNIYTEIKEIFFLFKNNKGGKRGVEVRKGREGNSNNKLIFTIV